MLSLPDILPICVPLLENLNTDTSTSLRYLCCVHRAMGGSVEFKDALTTRLGVMQPSQAQIQDFLAKHPHRISKGEGALLLYLRC